EQLCIADSTVQRVPQAEHVAKCVRGGESDCRGTHNRSIEQEQRKYRPCRWRDELRQPLRHVEAVQVMTELRCPAEGRCGGHHDRGGTDHRSEEHTSELQSRENLVCRLLLE